MWQQRAVETFDVGKKVSIANAGTALVNNRFYDSHSFVVGRCLMVQLEIL